MRVIYDFHRFKINDEQLETLLGEVSERYCCALAELLREMFERDPHKRINAIQVAETIPTLFETKSEEVVEELVEKIEEVVETPKHHKVEEVEEKVVVVEEKPVETLVEEVMTRYTP